MVANVGIRRILAPNPGPMTLDGTNTWIVGDMRGVIVVDPGPRNAAHIATLASLPVRLVVVTHHHHDHTDAAIEVAERVGVPLRGFDDDWCVGGDPLVDDEVLDVLEAPIRVVAAPGHTADSIALWIQHHGEHGAMVTGDTILGRGTTVIAQPDRSVDDYLATLDRLEAFGDARVLPGHGDELPSLANVVRAYREHRMQRLAEVREALAHLGQDASVEAVADHVYADVPSSVRAAVEASVAAQLAYLRG